MQLTATIGVSRFKLLQKDLIIYFGQTKRLRSKPFGDGFRNLKPKGLPWIAAKGRLVGQNRRERHKCAARQHFSTMQFDTTAVKNARKL